MARGNHDLYEFGIDHYLYCHVITLSRPGELSPYKETPGITAMSLECKIRKQLLHQSI